MLLIVKTLIEVPNPIDVSKKWASEFVIELDLCPFAKQPLEKGKIRWVLLESLESVDAKIEHFYKSEDQSVFYIMPLADDFGFYLDVFYFFIELINGMGYMEEMKIVTFHPEHCYEGVSDDDPINFANRSPFPMIQLLRKSDLENLGMNEEWKTKILQKNERVLESLGSEKLKEILNGFTE